MFNLNNLVQRAQSFIDPSLSPLSGSSEKKPSKATLFRQQFRLPEAESPLYEITAELTVPLPYKSSSDHGGIKDDNQIQGNIYAGKLHLSDNYLCFSTQTTSFLASASLQASSAFTGQTHGAGPSGNGFTLPLCAVRKVERLPTHNALCALALTTWTGSAYHAKDQNDMQRFTIQLAGSRQACDRFCDGLKKGLRNGVKQLDNLRTVVGDCYSEFLLSGSQTKGKEDDHEAPKEPPEAGLGMVFKYPGDPRKLRDRSKMRLWGEYFRGQYKRLCESH
jgi:TBC1 domain family member 8/9